MKHPCVLSCRAAVLKRLLDSWEGKIETTLVESENWKKCIYILYLLHKFILQPNIFHSCFPTALWSATGEWEAGYAVFFVRSILAPPPCHAEPKMYTFLYIFLPSAWWILEKLLPFRSRQLSPHTQGGLGLKFYNGLVWNCPTSYFTLALQHPVQLNI